MNEADTRAELIDPQLRAAGWVTGGDVLVQREYNINAGEIKAGGIRAGQLKADYILSYKNRKLAVVEAKSDEKEVGEGVAQAKFYAQKLDIRFTYAANGKEIYKIDMDGSEGMFKASHHLKSFGRKPLVLAMSGKINLMLFLLRTRTELSNLDTIKNLQ